MLREAGFAELREGDEWNVKPSSKVRVHDLFITLVILVLRDTQQVHNLCIRCWWTIQGRQWILNHWCTY